MKDLGGNIGVIGPRSSGKTTYLAAGASQLGAEYKCL